MGSTRSLLISSAAALLLLLGPVAEAQTTPGAAGTAPTEASPQSGRPGAAAPVPSAAAPAPSTTAPTAGATSRGGSGEAGGAAASGSGEDSGEAGHHHHRRPLKARFAEANTTHDGHLTLAQAQAANWRYVVKNFQAIDKDNKGYVTVEDIHAYAKARRAARRAHAAESGTAQ